MNVGELDVHLDGCGLDVFPDLEKDFSLGLMSNRERK